MQCIVLQLLCLHLCFKTTHFRQSSVVTSSTHNRKEWIDFAFQVSFLFLIRNFHTINIRLHYYSFRIWSRLLYCISQFNKRSQKKQVPEKKLIDCKDKGNGSTILCQCRLYVDTQVDTCKRCFFFGALLGGAQCVYHELKISTNGCVFWNRSR